MTTVIATFFVALLVSLGATPLARTLGKVVGAVDNPNARKVHKTTIPRSGGVAIFVAFIVTILLSRFLKTGVSDLLVWDTKMLGFMAGAVIMFAVGFLDDVYRLSARLKLLCQVLCATVAFGAGLHVDAYYFTTIPVHSAVISYFLTVFWFVLFINAINLIDGLDGLAGGITFFVCVMLAVLLVWQNHYLPAMLFATLGGAVLGFLRYNFNPASIFMGDGGSYFLGYAIAGLSMIGSAKTQTATVVLIPLLAMGIPVFDTVLSPIRRFLVGRKLFQPDKSHIHHKLLDMGFSTRKAVLLIYAISVALCLFAIAMVNFQDKRAGLFLIVVGIAAVLFTRKLGYFEYLASDKLFGWFRDITDVAGISHSRRSFLGLQIEISHARSAEEMWESVCHALEFLKFDRADLASGSPENGNGPFTGADRRKVKKEENGIFPLTWQTGAMDFHWVRGHYRRLADLDKVHMLTVKLPMTAVPGEGLTLYLHKDTKRDQLDSFTLRRVEQLRETMVRTLDWIAREQARPVSVSYTAPGHAQPIRNKALGKKRAIPEDGRGYERQRDVIPGLPK